MASPQERDVGPEERREIISAYMIHLDPEKWGHTTLEDLVRMAEEIHDRISSETSEFLVQVARGEHDFKVPPLTAYRPVPKNESIRY